MIGKAYIFDPKKWSDEGLRLTDFKRGTLLYVETRKSIYQIEVLEDRYVEIMGGMLQNGEHRFPKPISAVIAGSTFGGSMIKIAWIGYQMHMEIHLMPAAFRGQVLTTTAVQNVVIESPDKSWSYSLDWNK